jgi:hypothetical protein
LTSTQPFEAISVSLGMSQAFLHRRRRVGSALQGGDKHQHFLDNRRSVK